jgi:hypothetical protein
MHPVTRDLLPAMREKLLHMSGVLQLRLLPGPRLARFAAEDF